MVNPVNSPRAVPELGARKDDSQNQTPVQDVRKEAARQIERHKRRLEEPTPYIAQPNLRPTIPYRLAVLATYPDTKPDAAAGGKAPFKEQAPSDGRVLLPPTEDAKRQSSVTRSEVIAASLEASAGMPAEQGPAPTRQPEATQQEHDMPVPAPLTEGDDTAALVPQERPQTHAATPVSTGQVQQHAPPMPTVVRAQSAAAGASSLPVTTLLKTSVTTPVTAPSLGQGEATVFDVPLRGLGTLQSTQVSLNLASGQVVLTPSSERAAEVLINAAQRTDWVSVDDSTDQHQHQRHERDTDDEDGQ